MTINYIQILLFGDIKIIIYHINKLNHIFLIYKMDKNQTKYNIYNVGNQYKYIIKFDVDIEFELYRKISRTLTYLCIKQNIQIIYFHDRDKLLRLDHCEFDIEIDSKNVHVLNHFNKQLTPTCDIVETYLLITIASDGKTIGEILNWFMNNINKEYKKIIQPLEISINLYDCDSKRWEQNNTMPFRNWNSIFLSEQLKNDIMSDIKMYPVILQNMADFPNMNRRIIMFHGPPGTGKTSLAIAIASEYKCPIYKIQTSMFNDLSLAQALEISRENEMSIFLIEDTDQLFIDGTSKVAGVIHSEINNPTPEMKASLTFSGILNILDGVETPANCLFLLTSNRGTSYDDAVLRRVDRYWRIEGFDEMSMCQHIEFFKIAINDDKVIKAIYDIMIKKKCEMCDLKKCIERTYYKAVEKNTKPILSDVLKQIVDYVPLKKEIITAKPHSFIQNDSLNYVS